MITRDKMGGVRFAGLADRQFRSFRLVARNCFLAIQRCNVTVIPHTHITPSPLLHKPTYTNNSISSREPSPSYLFRRSTLLPGSSSSEEMEG